MTNDVENALRFNKNKTCKLDMHKLHDETEKVDGVTYSGMLSLFDNFSVDLDLLWYIANKTLMFYLANVVQIQYQFGQ